MIRLLIPLLISVFTFYIQSSKAQLFEWAKQIDGEGYWNEGEANCVSVDSSGNVYTIGFFLGTMDFNPGEETHNLSSSGYEDIYIQKLDPEGNFIWAYKLGGSSQDHGYSITISDSGYIFITGDFKGEVDFDPGTGVFNMTSSTDKDIFVAKYDLDANFIWAGKMGGSGADIATSITTDSLDNVYTTGYHYGSGDFDPGPQVYTLDGHGGAALFISKLDPAGSFIWAVGCGGTQDVVSYSIITDDEQAVYITGYFGSTVDFDPGPGVHEITPYGSNDAFIQKIDELGNLVWVKQFGGTESDIAYGITIDNAGNIISTGRFSGTADFDPNTGIQNLTAIGLYDIYIQKIDSNGNNIWVKQLAGSVNTNKGISSCIIADSIGGIYSTGHVEGIFDFDPGEGIELFGDTYKNSIYIHKLNSMGDFEWIKGMVAGGSEMKGKSVALDTNANIFSTGIFTGSVDFDTEEDTYNMTSGGGKSMYIHKIEACEDSFNTLDIYACDSYLSPSGNYLWDNSGIYYDTIPNISGCDSIITINLTITVIDTLVHVNNNVLKSNMDNAQYQWVDCENGFMWIDGEINQTYNPVNNGIYAVIVSSNNCSDTSSCHSIINIGIQQFADASDIKLYPNPAHDKIYVDSRGIDVASGSIYNILGVKIMQTPVERGVINISQLDTGYYLMHIQNKNGELIVTKSFCKE